MGIRVILGLIVANLILALILFFIFKKNYFLLVIYALAWGCILYKFPYVKTFLYFGVPHIVLAFLAHLLTLPKDYSRIESPFNMVVETTKGKRLIPDIDRGTQVFGSSGAGKTASVIAPFIRHYHKWNFAGLLYDYKNGELTELLIGAYGKDRVKVIAPHNPYISDRCNFLDPDILTDEIKIQEITKTILMNLNPSVKHSDFFSENAEALLSAVILKFKLYHPEMCTFPHICAFLTSNNFGGYRNVRYIEEKTGQEKEKLEFSEFKQLEDFLSENVRVKMQASAFLKGLASERQTASVLSTLLNALRKFANPRFFWVFSKSDFKLNINDKDNRLVVSVLNDPSIPLSVTPFIAGTMQAILGEMSIREQEPAFLALDEAATIKLPNMSAIPATMRSFGIATLYATQDISQGYAQFGVHEFKSILTNLSIQFFGNANDPDTAQFYEKYIDVFDKERISENKDTGFFGGSTKSVNVSKQETKRIKYTEFLTLQKGEFVNIINGVPEKIQFPMPKNAKADISRKSDIDDTDIENNFYNIINNVSKLTKVL